MQLVGKSMEKSFVVIKLKFFVIHFHGVGLFLFTSFEIFSRLNRFSWSSQLRLVCFFFFWAVPWKRSWRTRWLNFRLVVRLMVLWIMFSSSICSYVISNSQLKMFADSTGNNPSRISRGHWEACLYRFELSPVADQ